MKFYKVSKSGLESASGQEIGGQTKPFYLFLGGLFHVNGLELEKGLPLLLNDLCGNPQSPIFIAAFDKEPDIGHTAGQMHAYYKERAPTPEAHALVSSIFITQNSATPALPHCRLIGYSYGTSLIQQMEQILREKLSGDDLKLLEQVKCVNIGPVATPVVTAAGNVIYSLKSTFENAATPIDSAGHFRQITFFRASDKVMQEVIHSALIEPAPVSAHFTYGSQHLTFIGENVGDDMVRRIGFGKFASGIKTPQVTYNLDHEGHSLRVYTNLHTRETTDKGDFITILSSSLGHHIRSAITAMTRDDDMFDEHRTHLLQNWTRMESESVNALLTMHIWFDQQLGQYRSNTYQQNEQFIADVLEKGPPL